MYKRSGKHASYIVLLSAALLISLFINVNAQTKLIKRNGWYRDAPIEVVSAQRHSA